MENKLYDRSQMYFYNFKYESPEKLQKMIVELTDTINNLEDKLEGMTEAYAYALRNNPK